MCFTAGNGMCGIWQQIAIFPKEMFSGLAGVELVAPEYIYTRARARARTHTHTHTRVELEAG
jgi:hypothetical protein